MILLSIYVYNIHCHDKIRKFPENIPKYLFSWAIVVKILIIKYGKYANIFAEKMWVVTHIFFSKNTCESDIAPTRTVKFWPLKSLLS